MSESLRTRTLSTDLFPVVHRRGERSPPCCSDGWPQGVRREEDFKRHDPWAREAQTKVKSRIEVSMYESKAGEV